MKIANTFSQFFKRITFLWPLVMALMVLSCQNQEETQTTEAPTKEKPSNYQKLKEASFADPYYKVRKGKLITPSGRLIQTTLAITAREQQEGLSGTSPEDFGNNEGLLFFYLEEGPRKFWMVDTYFDLDIIFLDKELKILAIEKNVPAHPGRKEPPPIARTKTYTARHVLEIKSGTELSKSLREGMQLKWAWKLPLEKIESSIRSSQ